MTDLDKNKDQINQHNKITNSYYANNTSLNTNNN